MTRPGDAVVRFGTLRLALRLEHERYSRAFETHLRSVLFPSEVGDAPNDIEVGVVDEAPATERPDGLVVERGADATRWTTPAGRAEVTSREARFSMWPDAVSSDELLFWFTVLLEKVLLGRGLVRLHAAGVVVGDRAVVMPGEKGAGKSTVSLALGRRGAVVLGDDQLAIQADGASVVVAGSYPGIRLTVEAEAMLPAPLSVEPIVLAGVAKKEVPLEELVPAAPFEPFRPTDLWFPQVGGGLQLTALPAPAALARLLRAVAPHHRFADGADRAAFVDVLSALVAATRPCDLTLSEDLTDLERLWRELAPVA